MHCSKLFYVLFFGHISFIGLSQGSIIDSLESRLSIVQSQLDKGLLCLELAKRYQRVDLTQTKSYAQLGLTYVPQVDSLRAKLLDQLGRFHFYNSQIDSALIYFKQVESIYQDQNDQNQVASINISIGSALLRSGQFESATQAFINSASYFEKQQDEGNAAKCYVNIATAFAELEDYDTAIEYSLKALPILRRQKMTQVEMILLPNMATQFYKNGDEEKALQYYNEAEEIAIHNQNDRSLALIYNNLGDLYMSREDYNSAESYIIKAIDLKKGLNQLKGLEESYFNLGLIRFKNEDYRAALNYYKSIETTVLGADRVKVLLGIKDVYKNLGNTSEALHYSEIATALSDSLNQTESKKVIAEMSQKYQIAQKENEILKLSNQNQALEVAQLRNTGWIIFLLGLLAVSLVTAIAYVKNSQKKRKIAEQEHLIQQQRIIDKLKHQEQEAVEKMIIIQEAERNRISNDLHDSLGSKLSTLKRNVQLLMSEPSNSHKVLASSNAIAEEVYHDLRNLSHNINSGALMEQGLLPALTQMSERVSLSSPLDMKVIATDLSVRLKNHIEIQLFRIVQELVTNVIKHAQATEVLVQLTNHSDILNVIIEDNGIGFDPNKVSNGIGLKSINERLQTLGAELMIDSKPQSGTTIIFNIPL